MSPEELCQIAESKGIRCKGDPVFRMICREVAGTSNLDEMSEEQLESIHQEIINNPSIFSKEQNEAKDGLFFKDNFDYGSDSFLDKLMKRSRRGSK